MGLPCFQQLSESAILLLLRSKDLRRCRLFHPRYFNALVKWLEDKEDKIEMDSKQLMIDKFDLNLFSRKFLLNTVRKTNLFPDEDIFDVLEFKVKNIECKTGETIKKMSSLEKDIKSLQSDMHQVDIKSEQDNKSMKIKIRQLNVKLGPLENMWLNADINLLINAEVVGRMPRSPSENELLRMLPDLVSPFQLYLGDSPGVVFKLNSIEYVNKLQFTLNNTADNTSSNYYCSYTIETCMDEKWSSRNWTTVVDFSGIKCRGRQTVFFEKRRMLYICVRLKNYDRFDRAGKLKNYDCPGKLKNYYREEKLKNYRARSCSFEIDESDAVLMLDTLSGARVNLGQF